ncbi:hypothetical protein COCMIDRAFT_37269 [Bipolaris oryzae ATCC 44560]|uniref:Rhodopsin domain-containing protein n=1 Tax=Bipolaris oryzae ATCC 44560 TaxID=930090 RepID=W6YZZ5_COCMI|nr:uncharacterized protein COCMIDRAFT_37269 [Bipolaris oryzae ATCC 44560]EUC44937.1 hypothetical protein COCMIDRAFT_37269 [Bipolaris oryzae ATCC 44560]
MQGILPPPQGVIPDFSGTRSALQHQVLISCIAATAVSTFFLGLRLYTRIFLNRKPGFDDLLMCFSWLGCIAWFITCISGFQFGLGHHAWNVTPDKLMGYLKTILGLALIYIWTPALTKLSLLLLYYRINTDARMRIIIYALGILTIGYSLSITIVAVGPCNLLTYVNGKFHILTDFCIILLPLPMLHGLQLRMKQKILLGIVFTLGSGVVIVSIVRIIYIYNYIGNLDITFYQAKSSIFSGVELNVGIICASMATLKPFIVKYMSFLLPSTENSQRSKSKSWALSWLRPSRGQNKSYALGSLDNHKAKPVQNEEGSSIQVSTQYFVTSTERPLKDSDSTERIIAPDIRKDM